MVRPDVHRAGQPGRATAAVLDVDLDITFSRDGLGKVARPVQVALAERRMLEQLAELGQVAAGRRDVAVRLDHVEAQRLARVGHPAVRGGAGEQHVVTLPGGERAEDRLDGRAAGFDVDALVADRVAVQRRRPARDHVADAHVVVAEHQPATEHRVGGLDVHVLEQLGQAQVQRQQGLVRNGLLVREHPGTHVDQRRRDRAVVEQRGVGEEPLLAHQLLEVQGAVGRAVLRVPLRRDAARAAGSTPCGLSTPPLHCAEATAAVRPVFTARRFCRGPAPTDSRHDQRRQDRPHPPQPARRRRFRQRSDDRPGHPRRFGRRGRAAPSRSPAARWRPSSGRRRRAAGRRIARAVRCGRVEPGDGVLAHARRSRRRARLPRPRWPRVRAVRRCRRRPPTPMRSPARSCAPTTPGSPGCVRTRTYCYLAVHHGAAPQFGSFRTAPSGRAPFTFTSFGDQGTPTVGKQVRATGRRDDRQPALRQRQPRLARSG